MVVSNTTVERPDSAIGRTSPCFKKPGYEWSSSVNAQRDDCHRTPGNGTDWPIIGVGAFRADDAWEKIEQVQRWCKRIQDLSLKGQRSPRRLFTACKTAGSAGFSTVEEAVGTGLA